LTERHAYQRAWGILVIAALIAACVVIVAPFLAAFTWAIILAVSSWPGFVRLTRTLGNRRGLAAFVFAVTGFSILVVPLVLAGVSIARRAPAITQSIAYVERNGLPGPPDVIARLPLVGPRLHGLWAELSSQGSEVLTQYKGEINAAILWLLSRAGSFGLFVLQLALAIVVAALLLARAEGASALLRALAGRIGGAGALDLLPVAEHTIRAVSLGVVGTALAEGALSAIGFTIAGTPGAVLLGCATFLASVLQPGPAFVFLPAAAWTWWREEPGWAFLILAWNAALVVPIEMFGRPFFVSQGTGLPMVLVFFGVVGGVLAFGLIGIFVGATILAVSYTLLLRWLAPPAT
jgi:predicted PurR-regulated permease PerM